MPLVATDRDLALAAVDPVQYHRGRKSFDLDWADRHHWAHAAVELDKIIAASDGTAAVAWPLGYARPWIGFVPDGAEVWPETARSNVVLNVLARVELRRCGDFGGADAVRHHLAGRGYELRDVPGGTVWLKRRESERQ